MADSKITALASIGTGTDPANDPLVIVDVSDVSPGGMSATGTTKKVTLNNLLACSPTATLASATITGDLTVDTSTLKVDSTNNRVGIVNASPQYPLDVVGNVNTDSEIYSQGGRVALYRTAGSSYLDWASTRSLIFRTVTSVGGAGATTLATLDASGNWGLGVTPSAWNSAVPAIQVKGVNGLYGAGSSEFGLTQNAFYNSGGSWIYGTNAAAGRYSISTGTHAWYTAGSGTAGNAITDFATAAMTLNANAALVLKGGNASATGVGIAFPATQAASSDANTLDDYEEGTWTATLKGSVSDPTTPVTVTGSYTKIGRVVSVFLSFANVNTTGASGNVTITGLPFSAALSCPGSIVTFDMFTSAATLACYVAGTSISFFVSGIFSPATHSAGTGKYLNVALTYYV